MIIAFFRNLTGSRCSYCRKRKPLYFDGLHWFCDEEEAARFYIDNQW